MAQSQFDSAANSRKVLLTITDGGDNSSHATLTEAVNAMRKAGIVVYPIGMFDEKDRDQSPQVLSTIAQQTGGEAFLPGDVTDVNKICVSIAKEIREEYTLGFPGAEDGQYHRIRLTVKDPQHRRLEVQTRAGYVAGKPSGVGP